MENLLANKVESYNQYAPFIPIIPQIQGYAIKDGDNK